MGEPNTFVFVALAAFLPFVAACFSLLAPRRAVLTAILCGSMFLPHFDARLSFLGLYTKAMFVPAVVFLGSLAFDARRWLTFRPRAADLPVLVLCLGRFMSALSNDLGLKEAVAATLEASLEWGTPYFLGRAYLGSPRALKEFADAVVVAALAYVPFCLWEIRMSPQLHRAVYGFQWFSFDQVMRFGGYRPTVFMQHGLAVSMFMAVGTLVAFWLWRTKARERLLRVRFGWAVAALALTTILCRSTGALILLAAGAATLEATRHLRTSALVLALALIPAAYCTARLSGWEAPGVVAFVRERLGEDRAGSFHARIANETLMVKRAHMKPWLGWGRFGGSFAFTEDGRLATPDSLWIITLGFSGIVGIVALGALLALPALSLLRTIPPHYWPHPRLAPVAAPAIVLLLWAIDDLLNHMMSPIFPSMAGALLTFVAIARQSRLRHAPTGAPVRRVAPRASPSA